jgi:hypothetical protein
MLWLGLHCSPTERGSGWKPEKPETLKSGRICAVVNPIFWVEMIGSEAQKQFATFERQNND